MNKTAYKGVRDPINAPSNQLREFVRRGQAAQEACDKIIELHEIVERAAKDIPLSELFSGNHGKEHWEKLKRKVIRYACEEWGLVATQIAAKTINETLDLIEENNKLRKELAEANKTLGWAK
jgi:hypothetical protein